MSGCPACGGPHPGDSKLIRFCRRCGHRWLKRSASAHAAVEASTFGPGYSGYRRDPAYMAAVEGFLRQEIVKRAPPPARLLDVGCGAGDLMSVAQSFGYEVDGIDISAASAQIRRSRNLSSTCGDLVTHDFPQDFDVIVMWDLLAHLRDPASFIARARKLLAPGGLLFIKTPAFGDFSVQLANRWPRAAGVLLGAPSHNQYFSRQSLRAMLASQKFACEWIDRGSARSPAAGGSLKRRAARRLRDLIGRISGDENLYLVARIAG